MTLYNSNNFSKYNSKYLHKQPASLKNPSTICSYGWCCTHLTNLHSTWCTFCEEFQLANDQSNTWLSGSSSAVPTGAHPYWICSNREAACTQVVFRSDVSYTL